MLQRIWWREVGTGATGSHMIFKFQFFRCYTYDSSTDTWTDTQNPLQTARTQFGLAQWVDGGRFLLQTCKQNHFPARPTPTAAWTETSSHWPASKYCSRGSRGVRQCHSAWPMADSPRSPSIRRDSMNSRNEPRCSCVLLGMLLVQIHQEHTCAFIVHKHDDRTWARRANDCMCLFSA